MDDFENMSEFSPFTWQPVYSDGTQGEAMDFNISIEQQSHLSSSRGILETIVEETSDDEENCVYAKWSGSDSFSSGSSETGSVVHVEIQNDQDNQDAMSERDFICPPKRRRQEIDQSKLDFIPTSSLFTQLLSVPNASAVHNENGLFESYFMKQSDLRYRFDELGVELFSDSDRLSYTSLSRSSSLIQFESLERQLQSDSQISGSSPSIYSYEGASLNSTGNSVNQEICSEKSSAPIAINLPTIKVVVPPQSSVASAVVTASSTVVQFTNSDSEPYSSGGSSTSGSFSSDDCELLHRSRVLVVDKKQEEVVNDSSLSSEEGKVSSDVVVVVGMIKANEIRRKHSPNSFRAKNSVDSLSEDSGYSDRDTRRGGALSLPTGHDLEDEDGSVIEEKSIQQMRLLPRIRSHSDDDEMSYHSMENLNRRIKSRKIDLLSEINIEDTRRATTTPQSLRGVKIDTTSVHDRGTMVKNKMENSRRSPEIETREKLISISSPELYANGDNSRKSSARSTLKRNFRQNRENFYSVSSVPDYLNLLTSDCSDYCDFSTPQNCTDSVASKNFNLFDLNYGPASASSSKKCVDISASCANLTLLNYSDEQTVDFCYDSPQKLMPINRSKIQTTTMSGKMPTRYPLSSDDEEDDDLISTYRSKELTSLLEEISAHFNKNLSILNDREASYEPQTDVGDMTMEVKSIEENSAPKPPPRTRTQIKTSPNHKPKATFDQDPTNLTTTYAQSLEKCNFNVDEPVNVYNSRQNIYLTVENEPMATIKDSEELPKPVHKRNFVSSTPNLNYFDFEMRHVHHYSSTDNTSMDNDRLSPSFTTNNDDNRCTSMKEITSAHSRASSTGILASSTGGSKSHLSVSFCPIVSEISWQVNADDDDFSDDVEMDPSAGGDDFSSSRNDSLVNYYDNNDNDDDDDEDFDDFRAVGISSQIAMPINTPVIDDHRLETLTQIQFEALAHQHDQKINDENTLEAIIKTSTPPCVETSERVVEFEALSSQPVSQKMLVEAQTSSEKLIAAECNQSAATLMDANKVHSQSMTTVPQKMANVEKPDRKHKKSIFSRLSSGFRFSFRGKKNKKIANDGVVHYPFETNNNSDSRKSQQKIAATNVVERQKNGAKLNDIGEFVYIPLKAPTGSDNVRNVANLHGDKLAADLHAKLSNSQIEQQNTPQRPVPAERTSRTMQPLKRELESPPRGPMGKPPLPKQPPRIVGTTTKRPIAHTPRASSTPREYDNGEFYNQSMVGDGLKQQYYSERARTMDGGSSSGHKIGLIETNLDTDETIINGKTQSLMELGIGQNCNSIMGRMSGMGGVKVMQNVNDNSGVERGHERGRPHKSMEFLLDKENHQRILPPENELQKARESNITLSEHQLRVQASLQKLNIPDWYKQYSATGQNSNNASYYQKSADVSGILKKRNSDTTGRWQGLNSKTTSLSSLGSNRSDRSPVVLSPSAHSHHGGQSGFSRWSTSHLNSSQTSPSVSARSSFVRNTNTYSSTMSGQSAVSSTPSQSSEIRNSMRKPYLGWRSQEKLNQPRTAHERLASSLMSHKEAQQPIATPEIQSSIKEVTSAIVHYVNDQTNRGSRSRSVSPSARCWLESSFVGTKPLESPQTPAMENQFVSSQHKVNIGPMSAKATNYDSIRLNGIGGADASTTFVPSHYHSSARSSVTSLEDDVILSLLGLPSDLHKSSSEDLANQAPGYRGTSTFSTFGKSAASPAQKQPTQLSTAAEQQSHSRRHSEGDFQNKFLEHHSQDHEDEKSDEIRPLITRDFASTTTSPAPQYRRISLDSVDGKHGDMMRCRFPKCDVLATPADAKKNFKSCHNCTHLYCSRDCRRNHWERGHRRACLHSRASVLCRQVISTCKDDVDTLRHLSLLARRGYISQGRGVVRLLFRSPENADIFIKQGFQGLGEVSFVRWPELMPQEMGPELYSELLRLSIEYKPESKMLIYVAICVVSETPGSSTAPVKWERQLVSRCAKLKLCRTILNDRSLFMSTATTVAGTVKPELNTDVLILTFNTSDKFTQKSREVILANVQYTLLNRGISLRKHHPEVFQRLSNYVEGLSERFLPVTIHPRDSNTGRSFVCIIVPQNGDAEKIKLPPGQDDCERVNTIDVGIERTELTQSSLINDDIFTEGTKF